LLYLACGALLLAVVYTQPGTGWAGTLLVGRPARLIAVIGLHSYSIYLWHINPVRYALIGALTEKLKPFLGLTGQWIVLTTTYLAVSLLTGIVLGKLIEKPALLLRDRLFPARAKALIQG
jgi:peptidoglycan/LPS O-acetylase OafA/YrhL